MPEQAVASWYRDPYGRHELRYWDGGQWTQHVVSRGSQGVDHPSVFAPPVPSGAVPGTNAAQRMRPAEVVASLPVLDGTLFTAPILVVTQKAKLHEVNVSYGIQDQHGTQIGTALEVGQDAVKRILSPQPDSHRRRVLQVLDVNGKVRLVLTRPSTWFRSKMIIRGHGGAEIGHIQQTNLGILKIHFAIESNGELLGSVNGEDWESSTFNIRDAAGNEVGRISKKPARPGRQIFMKGEDYILEVHRHLEEPLRSIVVAAPFALDAALRRNQAGWEAARSNYRNRPRQHWNRQ